jgi:hypothetical protein
MTPKDKAKELVDKFTVVGLQQRNEGIQCAVIAVAEIISVIDPETFLLTWLYWKEVKQEIELIGNQFDE